MSDPILGGAEAEAEVIGGGEAHKEGKECVNIEGTEITKGCGGNGGFVGTWDFENLV